MVKNLPTVPEIWDQSLDREDSPWTEEPGGLQSLGSQRVGHY